MHLIKIYCLPLIQQVSDQSTGGKTDLSAQSTQWGHVKRGQFVCVEVLWPSQPYGVMLSAVSLPNHMFTGQALSSKRLTNIVHILSPETDNCPS